MAYKNEVVRINWWELPEHKKQLVDTVDILNMDTEQLLEPPWINIIGPMHADNVDTKL